MELKINKENEDIVFNKKQFFCTLMCFVIKLKQTELQWHLSKTQWSVQDCLYWYSTLYIWVHFQSYI